MTNGERQIWVSMYTAYRLASPGAKASKLAEKAWGVVEELRGLPTAQVSQWETPVKEEKDKEKNKVVEVDAPWVKDGAPWLDMVKEVLE